ncbi:histidine phosphatase superfamily [Xylariaceae sp. FL0255]|nr:histidine phosphatase superfamily [Xylariaceae sp. FL0255]
MRLLLIRHGESVDNVAGLYAGSRDSALTNHGVLQAKRLGAHIASRRPVIGSIAFVFASDLQRAYHTAEAIVEACVSSNPGDAPTATLAVTLAAELREKDFGASEGKKFGTREDLDGAESSALMQARAARFLDAYLCPAVADACNNEAKDVCIVIVAHGIILNVLLKELLVRYPLTSTLRQLMAERMSSAHLAPWSNTGVLQMQLARENDGELYASIEMTNNLDHLQGLRKTRGGIGSAQFDSRQRTMDSFFASGSRKRKAEDNGEGSR